MGIIFSLGLFNIGIVSTKNVLIITPKIIAIKDCILPGPIISIVPNTVVAVSQIVKKPNSVSTINFVCFFHYNKIYF